MKPVKKKGKSILTSVLILMTALLLSSLPAGAGANTNSTVFHFPILTIGESRTLGDISITETTPGTLKAGQDVEFTLINAELNGIDWDITPGTILKAKQAPGFMPRQLSAATKTLLKNWN